MPRGPSDIPNTALRIFLQDMGAAYDADRGFTPYRKKDFPVVREFFDERCCYCDVPFDDANQAVEDHLIPINRTELGLHSWGNVVASCRDCNAKKQGTDWREFIIERAGAQSAARLAKMKAFVADYGYNPSLVFRAAAQDLYAEMGAIATALIRIKLATVRASMEGTPAPARAPQAQS